MKKLGLLVKSAGDLTVANAMHFIVGSIDNAADDKVQEDDLTLLVIDTRS